MDYCQNVGSAWNRTSVSPFHSAAGAASSGGHKSGKTRGTSVSPASSGSYMNCEIGSQVKINRGGPESLEGKLVAANNNYVVLQAKEGIVYINASHVKSVTELPGQKSQGWTPKYIMAGSFNGVLHSMVKSFAQINWGGPEKIEGFIAEVGNDALLLVVGGQDLVRIPLYHIRTVKAAGKYTSGGSKSGGNKSGSSNSGGNKSGNNKTGGAQSGGNKSGNNRTGGAQSGGNKSNKGNRTGGNRSNRGRTSAATSGTGKAKRASIRRAGRKG